MMMDEKAARAADGNSYVERGTSATGAADEITGRNENEETEETQERTQEATGDDERKQVKPDTTDVNIGTLNLVDGRGNRLELACKALLRHGIDLCIATETKLNGFHTSSAYGYNIVATKCTNQHQGGVAILYRKNRNWHVESERAFGPNVIRATLVHEGKRTTIVGVYIPPSETDMTTMRHVDDAMRNMDTERTIILGDLNIHLKKPKDERSIEIAENIESYGLRDVAGMFKPRKNKRINWTWRTHRKGNKVQAICDYVLTGSELQWKSFGPIDLQHFDTDHRLIRGKLRSRASQEYKDYLKSRKEPRVDVYAEEKGATEVDGMVHGLNEALEKEQPPEEIDRSWISERSF
jgi:exonuclease III